MPSERAFFRASRAGPALAWIGRLAGAVLITGFGVFALVLLAVRLVVFPQVESYRESLATAISGELGRPVEIAVLATGWDGWNPKIVIEGFRVLDRERTGAVPLIELPVVELVVAWTSLPLMELRLKELVIERPRLAIRRDRTGMLHIAGIEFDPAQAPDDTSVTQWILRQPQIVIRDALIIWNDDLRNAPQLILDRVQFRLQNRFGRHRFGLTGAPPSGIAAPIDVRGDLRGISAGNWEHVQGALYVRLDYADVAAWREWLPLPVPIASGKGALRVWMEFSENDAREIVADLELAEVAARLGEHLPELNLAHLAGRVGWRTDASQREIVTRDLVFQTTEGKRLGPTDLKLLLTDVAGRNTSGRLEFDRLELGPLRDLAVHLPLREGIRTDIEHFSPRGTLSHANLRWENAADAPLTFSAAAEFTELGVLPHDAFPGVNGLSGRFEATHAKGELKIASRNVELALPNAFREPILVDTLEGALGWERQSGQTSVRIQKLEFATANFAGSAAGTYRTAETGPGSIDLNAHLARVDVTALHRYLPVATKDGVRDWMHTALASGKVADVRLKLAGDLADLPFAAGKRGQFLVTAKAKDLLLNYATGWPGIADLDADIRIEGARLTIDATRGHVYGAALAKTRAEIADLAGEAPLLRIDGSAAGPVADFLRFVAESPVAGWIEHLADGAQGAGEGRLALRLGLVLGRPSENKVAGDFTFVRAELRLPHAPMLTQLDGTLSFTESEAHSRDVHAQVLGGPAKLALASGDGSVRVTAAGSTPLVLARREFAHPYLDRLSGTIDWTIGVNIRPEMSSWVLESTLQGVGVDLPAPLGKAASAVMPLRVERRGDSLQPDQDLIVASYGRAALFVAHRRLAAEGAKIDRALLSLGRATERADALRAERPGYWLRADLVALDVDDWLALARGGKQAVGSVADAEVKFEGADLKAGELDAFGVRFHDLGVAARRSPEGWRLDLGGEELAGTATWTEPTPDLPGGRLMARLARLGLPGKGAIAPRPGSEVKERAPEPKSDGATGRAWPELDIVADTLASKGRDLGRLELHAKPRGTDWQIERLVLGDDNGRIEAHGEWRALGQQQQTRLDVVLDAKEAGAFLARFGYPDAMQGAPTKIDGHLAWSGTPAGFDYPTLSGALTIDVGPGRFTRIEPGLGKLIGVLSLQALPRRITLDFRDVFSEGFAFDEVTGKVRIANGVMSTDGLKLVGPAARVQVTGDADLAGETQRLSVRVQPALSGGMSAGAALLFLANPLIGAAVGAGSLLAQKVLKDPIEQMFSYEYTVTGSWSDPVVTRSESATASVVPGAPGTPVERTAP